MAVYVFIFSAVSTRGLARGGRKHDSTALFFSFYDTAFISFEDSAHLSRCSVMTPQLRRSRGADMVDWSSFTVAGRELTDKLWRGEPEIYLFCSRQFVSDLDYRDLGYLHHGLPDPCPGRVVARRRPHSSSHAVTTHRIFTSYNDYTRQERLP